METNVKLGNMLYDPDVNSIVIYPVITARGDMVFNADLDYIPDWNPLATYAHPTYEGCVAHLYRMYCVLKDERREEQSTNDEDMDVAYDRWKAGRDE